MKELRVKTAPVAAQAGLRQAVVGKSKQLMEGLLYLSEQAARDIGINYVMNDTFDITFWCRGDKTI